MTKRMFLLAGGLFCAAFSLHADNDEKTAGMLDEEEMVEVVFDGDDDQVAQETLLKALGTDEYVEVTQDNVEAFEEEELKLVEEVVEQIEEDDVSLDDGEIEEIDDEVLKALDSVSDKSTLSNKPTTGQKAKMMSVLLKEHIKKHKVAYAIGTSAIVIGATALGIWLYRRNK